jgi:hypothetical protein
MSRRALARVTSYRRFPQSEKQQRSIIRITRMLRIRQLIGLSLSIENSIWPLRAAAYINSGQFSSNFTGRRPFLTVDAIPFFKTYKP